MIPYPNATAMYYNNGMAYNCQLTEMLVPKHVYDMTDQLFDAVHGLLIQHNYSLKSIHTVVRKLQKVYVPKFMNDQGDVADYSDPAIRFAYIYRVFIAHCLHVRYVYYAMNRDQPDVFGDLLNAKCIKICSIGGGPAPDVIGFVGFLKTLRGKIGWKCKSINYCNLDKFKEWEEVWDPLWNQCVTFGFISKNFGKTFSTVKFDIWDAEYSKEALDAINDANILTMVKSLSSIAFQSPNPKSKGEKERRKTCSANLRRVFAAMAVGALFIYIDNSAGPHVNLASEAAQQEGLKRVFVRKFYNFQMPGHYANCFFYAHNGWASNSCYPLEQLNTKLEVFVKVRQLDRGDYK